MKNTSILIFVTLFQLTIFCQSDDTFFLNIMKTEFEAFQKKNPAQWMTYVDEDALFTDAENEIKTKEQIMEEMEKAPDIFLSASETYENIITKIYGSTAILSCLTSFSFKSSDGNLNRLKFKFTRVHIKDGNSWKLVYHSAVPI